MNGRTRGWQASRRPCYWHRVGIPGSGGKQWLRADVEYVMAFQEKPGKIMWADNTGLNGSTPPIDRERRQAAETELARMVKGARNEQDDAPAGGATGTAAEAAEMAAEAARVQAADGHGGPGRRPWRP